jgi:hypothetical protein
MGCRVGPAQQAEIGVGLAGSDPRNKLKLFEKVPI